jgi:hypothetical protein
MNPKIEMNVAKSIYESIKDKTNINNWFIAGLILLKKIFIFYFLLKFKKLGVKFENKEFKTLSDEISFKQELNQYLSGLFFL